MILAHGGQITGGGEGAVFHEPYPVGDVEGGVPVGDGDDGGVGKVAGEVAENGAFGAGVDGGGGVVKDEDARVTGQGPRQGDALALAAGKREATLAHSGVEAVRKVGDCAVYGGVAGGCPNVIVREATAHINVVADGGGIQKRLIEHACDSLPQVGEIQAAVVGAAARGVDKRNAAGIGLVEAA